MLEFASNFKKTRSMAKRCDGIAGVPSKPPVTPGPSKPASSAPVTPPGTPTCDPMKLLSCNLTASNAAAAAINATDKTKCTKAIADYSNCTAACA